MDPQSLYKPEYCQMLIDHMKEGLSFETFSAVIGVHRATLYRWVDKSPEFADAKKRAFDLCQLWWEKAGNAGLYMGGKDNPFNATVFIFNMKNRFGWRDKVEIKTDSQEITLNINVDSE